MTTRTISVRVLLFAAYREAVGRRELVLEVGEGATVEQVFWRLAEEYPSLTNLRSFTAFAVNRDLADPDTHLKSGDEIAFLQPLSGGAA